MRCRCLCIDKLVNTPTGISFNIRRDICDRAPALVQMDLFKCNCNFACCHLSHSVDRLHVHEAWSWRHTSGVPEAHILNSDSYQTLLSWAQIHACIQPTCHWNAGPPFFWAPGFFLLSFIVWRLSLRDVGNSNVPARSPDRLFLIAVTCLIMLWEYTLKRMYWRT